MTKSSREGREEGKNGQDLALPKAGELPRNITHLIGSRADSQHPPFIPIS